MSRFKKGLVIFSLVGAFLLLGKAAKPALAQCASGEIDMLDYMLPDDQTTGNAMSNGECFYIYEDTLEDGTPVFYIVKSCNNPIYFEQYTYDDNWIYIMADTTWTSRCFSDGSEASGIYTHAEGGTGPGAQRYPRCMSEGGGMTSISGNVSGLSKTTCNPCDARWGGDYGQNINMVVNPDGTITWQTAYNPEDGSYHESYTYSETDGWTGFTGPTGDNTAIGDSPALEADRALLDCTELPPIPPGGADACFIDFPEPIPCCPIASPDGPNWIEDLANRFIGSLAEFVEWLLGTAGVTIESTLYTRTPDLFRSIQPVLDANYFFAGYEKDPRLIYLPYERMEGNGMRGGTLAWASPPGRLPPAMWSDIRDTRVRWEIPLSDYEVEDWSGDDGDWGGVLPAFFSFARGADTLWRWLIYTPGMDERVAAAAAARSLAEGGNGQPKVCEVPPPTSSSESSSNGFTSQLPPTPVNSSQTTSAQTASTASSSIKITADDLKKALGSNNFPEKVVNSYEVKLAQEEDGEEACASLDVICGASNWTTYCTVNFTCDFDICGHYWVHLNGELIGHGNCPSGILYWTGSFPSGTPSATISVNLHGNDKATCMTEDAVCEIEFDPDTGAGGCTTSIGSPCAPGTLPSPAVDICQPPLVNVPEGVCSRLGEREIILADALTLILRQYIHGGVELYPRFPLLETIGYRLAGIFTELYGDWLLAGVRGVLDGLLPPRNVPPNRQNFPTLSVNAWYTPRLDIYLHWGCPAPWHMVGHYACNGADMGCCPVAEKDRCCGPCQNLPCDCTCKMPGVPRFDIDCDDCGICRAEGGDCSRDCPTCEATATACCLGGCPGDDRIRCIPLGYHIDVPLESAGDGYLINDVGSPPIGLMEVQAYLARPL